MKMKTEYLLECYDRPGTDDFFFIVLTFVLVYELIQMILEKNNMHEFDTFNIFKWIFKTFVATYLLTNCFTIVMAVFDPYASC